MVDSAKIFISEWWNGKHDELKIHWLNALKVQVLFRIFLGEFAPFFKILYLIFMFSGFWTIGCFSFNSFKEFLVRAYDTGNLVSGSLYEVSVIIISDNFVEDEENICCMVYFYVVFKDLNTTFETDLYDHILEVLNGLDYPEDQQIKLQVIPWIIILDE